MECDWGRPKWDGEYTDTEPCGIDAVIHVQVAPDVEVAPEEWPHPIDHHLCILHAAVLTTHVADLFTRGVAMGLELRHQMDQRRN